MARTRRADGGSRRRAGSALVTVTVASAGLAMLAFSLLAVSLAGSRAERGTKEDLHARYVCEAGLAAAVYDLSHGGTGNLGTSNARVAYGDARYWVQSTDLGRGLFQLQATGVDDRQGARMELVVRRDIDTIFRFAAFGDTDLHTDSNARVDSYDSAAGTYDSQAVNGSGSNLHAHDLGDVGSNADVSMNQNAQVWGNARPGPGHAAAVLGNAQVSGSTVPMDETMALPPLVIPSIASSGPKVVANNLTVSIGPGDFHYDSLVVGTGGTLNVTGPARIVLGDCRLRSQSKLVVQGTHKVEIWVEHDFLIDSNVEIGSTRRRPRDLAINLLSDNIVDLGLPDTGLDVLSFDSNSRLYGSLYSPNAAIEMDSNFETFGSIVGASVDLDSNSRVHFDEDLLRADASEEVTYTAVCWRRLPYGGMRKTHRTEIAYTNLVHAEQTP